MQKGIIADARWVGHERREETASMTQDAAIVRTWGAAVLRPYTGKAGRGREDVAEALTCRRGAEE